MINKIGRPRSGSPICESRVWLQTELDDTMSCYQLIKTMAKFEKRTNHRLSSEQFLNVVMNAEKTQQFTQQSASQRAQNRLQNSRFRKAGSAVSVILECEAREPHTPARCVRRENIASLTILPRRFSLVRSNMVRRSRSQKIRLFCSLSAKWRALSNYKHDVCNCPINAQIGLLIANQHREFGYSSD